MTPIRSRRRTAPALLIAALAVTASGCGPTEPVAIPSTTPSTSASSSPTSSPSQDPSAWAAGFTAKEIKAYDAALRRWESYETSSEPIWAAGKATPAAEALFKEYWVAWQIEAARLKMYETNGITVSGLADVLWSKAKSIDLTNTETGAPRVVIQQCIDPSTITVLPPASGGTDTPPYLRTITLDEPPGREFMVVRVGDITNQKKVAPCEP